MSLNILDLEDNKNNKITNVPIFRYAFKPFKNIDPFLRKVFIYYLISIFVFSIPYFFIYQYDPNSFLINEKIHEKRIQDLKLGVEKKVDLLNKELASLENYEKKIY